MRSITLTLALALAGVAAPVSAQYATDFRGAYELVRIESLNDDGEWVPNTGAFGGDPTGVIMYDGTGTMGVHIVRSGDGAGGSGYFAYYGRYTVDAERGLVTHHLEGHTNASQVGSDNVRGFDFDGDLLTLTVEPQRQTRLTWRRRR